MHRPDKILVVPGFIEKIPHLLEPLSVSRLVPGPVIVILAARLGRFVDSEIMPVTPEANTMSPPVELALRMASRREPAPESFKLDTVNVAAESRGLTKKKTRTPARAE
jgi:hypothetical protein